MQSRKRIDIELFTQKLEKMQLPTQNGFTDYEIVAEQLSDTLYKCVEERTLKNMRMV